MKESVLTSRMILEIEIELQLFLARPICRLLELMLPTKKRMPLI